MKNLLIGLVVLILFSCSSNPKITTEKNLEQLLIEKPRINYKLKSLPKDINVVYHYERINEFKICDFSVTIMHSL